MAQISYLWTTDDATPVGHQVSLYTQVHHSDVLAIAAACGGEDNGVAPGWPDGTLAGSVTGANTVQIGAGAAMVDGKAYKNDAAENINIPSAVGSGNTRIDRIVLRADWANFQVTLHRIEGTDAGSPTAPSLVQTPGTTYDLPLYQALVDTAGNVTLTNEKDWATPSVDQATIEIDQSTGEIRVVEGGIDNSQIRNAVATSVIGRSAGSSGDVADIQATADNRILARVSGVLSWVQLALEMIPDGLITEVKLAAAVAAQLVTGGDSHDHDGGDGAQIPTGGIVDLAITNAKLGPDAVDQTKIADDSIREEHAGGGIVQFPFRQGLTDSTNWDEPGSSLLSQDFNIGPNVMQLGSFQDPGTSATGDVAVTFPQAFSAKPIIFTGVGSNHDAFVRPRSITTTGFTLDWRTLDGSTITDPHFFWIAFGPE